METKELYLENELKNQLSDWFRKAAYLGAVTFFLLSFLDYSNTPENFKLFLVYRISISIFLLIIVLISNKYPGNNIAYYRVLSLIGIIGSAIVIELMIIRFGGYKSPYFAALILLGVCSISFLPAGLKFHLLSAAAIITVYFVPIMFLEYNVIGTWMFFFSNTFMIMAFAGSIYFRYIKDKRLIDYINTKYDNELNRKNLEKHLKERTEELLQSYDVVKESEKKFKTLFNQASDSIFLLDFSEDGPPVIADVNLTACESHGYSKKEMVGKPISFLNDKKTADDIPGRMEKLFTGESIRFEGQHLRKDGSVFPVDVSAQIVNIGGKDYILGIDRDISERKKMEEQLVHQALYDSLTGLPNRILFIDRLKNLFAKMERHKDVLFALAFIDIDHFKKINDSYGHIYGDKLLVKAVSRLKKSLRPGDTLSRFGGDEFLLILDDLLEEQDAIHIADRIQKEMSIPFNIDGHEVYISVSIGIAFSNNDYKIPENMIRDADNAMYRAKEQGRACYVIFDKEMHHSTLEKLKLENDLRKAIVNDEFILYYQPIIEIMTRKTMGYEALIRWEHPLYGLIQPNDFIKIAESTGMIIQIGEWVLEEVCRQIREWQDLYPDNIIVVSVNLSAKQFNSQLLDFIEELLDNTGIDPQSLRLEITESVMMKDMDGAIEILTKLKEMNLQVYIDDFGTGYSSLNYIHKFPVNALKIDRSFVENIQEDEESLAIIKAVTHIAKNLNLNLIVEGIEKEEQLDIFRELECDFIQGFLFSEPLNSKDILKYMEKLKDKESQ